MKTWMWVQRSLPLIPVLPCLAALLAAHVYGRAGQAAVGPWTRPQLVAVMLLAFGVLTGVTKIADYGIVAYGLAG